MPTLTFHPLTPKRWPDVEKLFGARGACGGCWCMFWRQTRERQWRVVAASDERTPFPFSLF